MVFLVVLLINSCSWNPDSQNPEADDSADSLRSWEVWAESSCPRTQVGLDSLQYRKMGEIAGDSIGEYFTPSSVCLHDGSVIIADQTQGSILSVDIERGELEWVYAATGEGPGHFSQLGHIAAADSLVFVGNIKNNRIEVLKTDGSYEGYMAIEHPYDICVVDDSILVASSLAEEDLLTLFDIGTLERLRSFGSWPTDLERPVVYSNRNLFVEPITDSLLAVASFYESKICVFDIDSGELVREFYRDLPFEIERNEPGFYRIHIADISSYSDTSLIVVLPPFTHDRVQVEQETLGDVARLAVCDMYSPDGSYIGSSILPENCQAIDISGDTLASANPLGCTVGLYRVERR